MRIGLYGLPTAGKSYITDRIDFMETLKGSNLLRAIAPNFDNATPEEKKKARKELAKRLRQGQSFVMDGHYAFGNDIVFTQEDGDLYDVFIYIFCRSEKIRERMTASERNSEYASLDIDEWQDMEIRNLRRFCHENDKDFFVLDEWPKGVIGDITPSLNFMKSVQNGFSNVSFAKEQANQILTTTKEKTITLTDGDRTLIKQDSSKARFDYKTNLFDGNFYTGFQSWRQARELSSLESKEKQEAFERNEKTTERLKGYVHIVSAGFAPTWETIAKSFGYSVSAGEKVSADTKFFIAKFLRQAGKFVRAIGDSATDIFMLHEADEGVLVSKEDGSLSRSLANHDLGGLAIV